MMNINQELDRYLTLLRNKIRERGFTQLEVQEALGWGRSYISQLLTKQKCLRLEQVLSILRVIGIEPREFFTELYEGGPRLGATQRQPSRSTNQRPNQQLNQLTSLVNGLLRVLTDKKLITRRELSVAVLVAEAEPPEPN